MENVKEEFCHYCELVNELIDRYHENGLDKPIGLPNIMKESITSNDDELNYFDLNTDSNISFTKDDDIVRIVSRRNVKERYRTAIYEIANIDGFIICKANINGGTSIDNLDLDKDYNYNYMLMGYIGYDYDINDPDVEIENIIPKNRLYIYRDIINKFEDISGERIFKKKSAKQKIK